MLSYPIIIIVIIIIILLLLLSLLFVNVSMNALGVFDNSCESLTKMLKDLDVEVSIQRRLLSKIISIAIAQHILYFAEEIKTGLIQI